MKNPSERAEIILDSVLDLSPAERAAFVEEACAGDEPLRQLVEALLQAHGHAPATRPTTAMAATAEISEKVADRIGPTCGKSSDQRPLRLKVSKHFNASSPSVVHNWPDR